MNLWQVFDFSCMLQLKKVGDVVQMVFFWFLFRRQDDKGPVVVLEGGWKLRCESLASHTSKNHSFRTCACLLVA